MNASFLQELGFQIRWIEWLIVTKRGKEMSQTGDLGEGSGKRQAQAQQGSTRRGSLKREGGLKEAISLRGKNLGIFVWGLL